MKITDQKLGAIAKTKSQPKAASSLQSQVDTSNGTMATMAAVPAIIGLWAAACFIGGMISSGGPIEMVKNWFLAVTG